MVIMEENKGYQATLGSCGSDPYLCSLASQYATYTNWNAISHPSLPNYLAVDRREHLRVRLGRVSRAATTRPVSAASSPAPASHGRRTWSRCRSPCDTVGSAGLYARKHDPFVFFNDVAQQRLRRERRPVSRRIAGLISDLNGPGASQFVWITPNLNDDMHNGSVAQGDAWLQANLAPVLTSPGSPTTPAQ